MPYTENNYENRLIVGIDLSGPSSPHKTGLAIMEGPVLTHCSSGWSDKDILAFISRFRQCTVCIDAPLSYMDGGGYRPCDGHLKNLLVEKGFNHIGVMPPTFNKMVYITLRGMHLASELSQRKLVSVIEVHPGAHYALEGYDFHALTSIKQDAAAMKKLLRQLHGRVEIHPGIKPENDNEFMAVGCALAAYRDMTSGPNWCCEATKDNPYRFIA